MGRPATGAAIDRAGPCHFSRFHERPCPPHAPQPLPPGHGAPCGRLAGFPSCLIPLAIRHPTTMVRLVINASRDVRELATNIIDLSGFRRPYVGYAASPFRYPGGKGFLTPLLSAELARRFGGSRPSFAEPYCGGAGAATNLLLAGEVDQLFLNDADRRIYSAWRAMLTETDRFLEKIMSVKVTLATWDDALVRLYETPLPDYDFELGFSAFFVNRTSRSGVVIGSGPIGGYSQEGRWKIDARFNRETLAKRVCALGALRDQITLSCQDGLQFCYERAQHQRLLVHRPTLCRCRIPALLQRHERG